MNQVLTGDSVKEVFQGLGKKYASDRCVSITFHDDSNRLNFMADSPQMASCIVQGLQVLISNKGMLRI